MHRKKPRFRPRATALSNEALPARDSRVWLILVLALAAVLRLYALGSIPPGLTNDEAQDGLSARHAIEQGLRVFYPENNGREGLYINLSTPLVLALGNTVWAIRLPSAIFGILTVWLTYLLGVQLFSRRVGLWGALFVAASSWHLYNSRLTNRANAAPLFLALTLYLLIETAKRIRAGRPYLAVTLLGGAVYGLGFHTYTSFRVTPLLILGGSTYLLVRARAEGLWRPFWLASAGFAGAAAATVVPLARYFWVHTEMFTKRAAQVAVWSQPNPGSHILANCRAVGQMFFWRGDADWKNNFSGQRELFLPVAILFAIGLGLALWRVGRGVQEPGKTSLGYLLLFAWIAVGAVPSILTVDEIHALRASLMIPPVFLFAAIGVERIGTWLEQTFPRGFRVSVTVCFVLAVCYEPCKTYFQDWAAHPNVARDFAEWLTVEGKEIRDAPLHPAKYVAIPEPVFAYGEVPQVIEYLTRTSTEADRERANIHYLFPRQDDRTDPREFCSHVKAEHPNEQVFCVAKNLPLRP